MKHMGSEEQVPMFRTMVFESPRTCDALCDWLIPTAEGDSGGDEKQRCPAPVIGRPCREQEK